MNDQELQIELAKMLPEKIEIHNDDDSARTGKITPYFYWKDRGGCGNHIHNTEWLHACWLIEQGMTPKEHETYRQFLCVETTVERYPKDEEEAVCYSSRNEREYASASWQQRAAAILATVKGEK